MAAQVPDQLLMENESLELFCNPLEEYWQKMKKKRPAFKNEEECRRGYVASWEIRDGQLFLINVIGKVEKRSLFGRKEIETSLQTFFKKAPAEGVKAEWFSGKLRIPRGNMTQYEHSGYDSRFEREQIITVDKGNVIKYAMLDYTKRKLVVT